MGLKNPFKKGERQGAESSYAPSEKMDMDEETGHATNVQTGWYASPSYSISNPPSSGSAPMTRESITP
jgi:hypothetical protein